MTALNRATSSRRAGAGTSASVRASGAGLGLVEEPVEGVALDAQHHVAEDGEEAPVAVPREALVAGPAGQPVHRPVVETEVEHGVHHAGHGRARAGPHRDQQGPLGVAQPEPHRPSSRASAASPGARARRARACRRRHSARQASVVMVKPGGTGMPRLVISASSQPLPPRRSRMRARSVGPAGREAIDVLGRAAASLRGPSLRVAARLRLRHRANPPPPAIRTEKIRPDQGLDYPVMLRKGPRECQQIILRHADLRLVAASARMRRLSRGLSPSAAGAAARARLAPARPGPSPAAPPRPGGRAPPGARRPRRGGGWRPGSAGGPRASGVGRPGVWSDSSRLWVSRSMRALSMRLMARLWALAAMAA